MDLALGLYTLRLESESKHGQHCWVLVVSGWVLVVVL